MKSLGSKPNLAALMSNGGRSVNAMSQMSENDSGMMSPSPRRTPKEPLKSDFKNEL